MTVHNIIGDGARLNGVTIQAGTIGNWAPALRDPQETAARLAELAAEPGPRLALTTAGEAKALMRLMVVIGDTHPELAEVADALTEALRARLAEHQP
ncbi:hypothetical protein [Streptomyces sp. WAC 06725]|uniref:hypothetical protein n=1 Tax=Streptomyces sp. WAC 06725 TaxID=2203209 RepID=UPI000F74B3F7|nr:hypothetical protein [Streptomyces sp. WAC 06725]